MTPVLLGLGFGAGILLIVSGLWPAHPALAVALERLHRPGVWSADPPRAAHGTTLARLLGGSWAASGLGRRITRSAARDLRVVGLSPEEHLAHRVSVALVGTLWAPVSATLMTMAGVSVPSALTLWVSAALAPAGFFLPAVELRARAARQRRSFRTRSVPSSTWSRSRWLEGEGSKAL